MRSWRASLLVVATLVLVEGALMLAGVARGKAESDQGFLAGLISQALSTSSTQVTIGAVDGALSSDATIRDIVISDRDGVWLKLDRARLVWRRTALFLRRLEVDRLEIGHLAILRRPVPSDQPVPPAGDQPILPDLPVKVQIKAFELANLDLGKGVLGEPLQAKATGNTELGSPSEGLVFRLDAQRLDNAGTLSANLAFVPSDNRLNLHVGLIEPAGGLLSKIGHVPGEPPINFDVSGNGSLDDFTAGLTFVAGPTIDATGSATLKRQDAGRHLGLALSGRFGDLLPSLAGSIFAGKTELSGDMRFADGGAFDLSSFAVRSRLAKLEAHGSLGADKTMDFALAIGAVPTDGAISKAEAGEIRKLAFDGRMTGPVQAPVIAATLAVEDARLREGRIGKLDASFSAKPSGALADETTRVWLDGSLTASDIAPTDAALARAIGGRIALALRGTTDTRGNGQFERIEAKTPTLDVVYAGALGRDRVHGTLTGRAPDLSRFGAVAGLRLAGASTLAIDLDGVPRRKTMTATIAAAVERFATGIAVSDRLFGGTAGAKGALKADGGRYSTDGFDIAGAHVAAHVAGTAASSAADLVARIDLPDLARADDRLTGKGRVEAHLTGGLDRPAVSLAVAMDGATALGRPIPHLGLLADVKDGLGLADTHVTLDGSVGGKPATGAIHLARRPAAADLSSDAGWVLSQLDVTIGSVALHGAGGVDSKGLAQGAVHLAAGDLDDLSPLALTAMSGNLSLDATANAPDGRQSLDITASGKDIRAASAAIRTLSLRAHGADLYAKPVLDADLGIDQAVVAGQTISSVRVKAKGATDASDISLSARAAGFDLDASGRLLTATGIRLALARFDARRGGRKIALAGPAAFAFEDGGVAIDHCVVAIDGGRLDLRGRAGKVLDLAIDARAIPLAAAEIFMPGLGLSGTFDASAKIGGTPAVPTGPYRVVINRLAVPRTRSAGVAPIDIAASGRLDGGRAGLEAKITVPRAGVIAVTGTVPTDASGTVDLAARGKLDAAVANGTLGPQGRQLGGSIALDMKLGGTRAAPRASGSIVLSGGTFRDVPQGVTLTDLQARLRANGDVLNLESASATTPKNGTISASGQVRLAPEAGFPGRIALRGQHATLVSNSLMTASADLALDMTGALARDPRITGRVDVIGIDVSIPDRLPTSLKPIDGITHVEPPPAAAARIATAQRKQRAAAGTKGRPALFDATLDLAISAPNRIFVRGRGLDAEVGGSLRVTGSTERPVPTGSFDLRRGRLAVLGKTLTFTKGRVTFSGDLTPELDFMAESQAGDVTAQIAVTGTAARPVFAFTSQPDLPQDEVLSRLLFAKSSGSLSAFQAVQLAQAAAQYSSGGDDAFETLRKSLGVDSLDIQTGSSGPSVGVSRAISDRVSVGVRTGATPDQTGLSADVDVTRHVRVQSDVRSNGATSVGVGTEVEY